MVHVVIALVDEVDTTDGPVPTRLVSASELI